MSILSESELCAVSYEDHDGAYRKYEYGCRYARLEVSAPADRVTVLCGNRGSDNVSGSSDRSCAAADVSTKGQRPCEYGKVRRVEGAACRCKSLDDRNHSCSERNVVHDGACHCGKPYNDDNNKYNVAAAYHLDEVCNQLKYVGLLKAADNNKQSDEEQQGLVVDLLYKFKRVLSGGDQRQHGNNRADERNGKSGLGVCDEHNYSTEENHYADNEAALVSDRFLWVGHGRYVDLGLSGFLEILSEDEQEIEYHKHKANSCDNAGIRQEVRKGIAERCTYNDVWRVAAHGRGAAEVRAEHL